MGNDSPNALTVGWSVVRAMRVRRPAPGGTGTVDHSRLRAVLDELRRSDVPGLPDRRPTLAVYRSGLESVNPDDLTADEALAFWLNLYNAGALDVAARAAIRNEPTVLRIPGAFSSPWTEVAGERLSLDDIEHGKIRRFRDPRIHGALVCGSASCPTLRYEPYEGGRLDDQLDDQMRTFLAGGGAVFQRDDARLLLSRVFLWYGADFVRPQRMPTWVPARKRAVRDAVLEWLDPKLQDEARSAPVSFHSYDWGLACAVS